MDLGQGRHSEKFQFIAYLSSLDLIGCQALLFFRSFTGCEVRLAMFGIGKKTAWNAWTTFSEVTDTFVAITQDSTSLTLSSLHMKRLEC